MHRLASIAAVAGLFAAALTVAVPAAAQVDDPAAAVERRAAMARLHFMKGIWVGPATGANRDGSNFAVTQTERIGPMLDGDVLVIEGKGFREDGSVGFNAFAVVSYDTARDTYEIRSYAQGYAGTFPMTVSDTGYVWEIPAGPGVMRYSATIEGERFSEVGDFVMEGRPPVRTFQMDLTRRGGTDWPAAGAAVPAPSAAAFIDRS